MRQSVVTDSIILLDFRKNQQHLPGRTAEQVIMEDKSMSTFDTALLVAEFQRITEDYNKALENLNRRAEIVYKLVQSGLRYREVGMLLGISAGRVGQLVKESVGYVAAHSGDD